MDRQRVTPGMTERGGLTLAALLALALGACQPGPPAAGDTCAPGSAPPRGDRPEDTTAPDLEDSGDRGAGGDSGADGGDRGEGDEYDDSYGGSGGDEVDCADEPAVEGDPLAALGECDWLVYAPYAGRDRDRAADTLPDFSYAGFERGGVAPPEVEVVRTVSPGSGDDRARIQDAIDAVSERSPDADGYRGAVLLTAGEYQCERSLRVEASGVVLRGEGQGEGGTVIVATGEEQYALIEIIGEGGPQQLGAGVAITDPYVPVGARAFAVADASGFSAGDPVAVVRTPDDAWVEDLGMDRYDWDPATYEIAHERAVAHVDYEGDVVTVDIPLVDSLAEEHGGGRLVPLDEGARVHHVGVEDLRLDSEYDGEEDEDHGWTGVKFEDAEHTWVRRVTVVHFGSHAVSVDGSSRFITVEDVAMIDLVSPVEGGNRYPFEVNKGLGVLFQRCYTRGARHSFVAGSRVTGPNVWLDCLAEDSTSDDGPHHRWATGLLFDNTRSYMLRVQNRADSGSGHGWSGAQVMFWNNEVTGEFVSDAPPGAMNWAVGVVGPEGDGQWVPDEPPGIQESLGEPVLPRSLYLQQLADRLGDDAVLNITTEAQRAGTLWDDLADWAGESRPE